MDRSNPMSSFLSNMPSASSNKYQYPQLIGFTKGSSNNRAAARVAGQIVLCGSCAFAPIIYLIGGFFKMAWYWLNFIVEDCCKRKRKTCFTFMFILRERLSKTVAGFPIVESVITYVSASPSYLVYYQGIALFILKML